LSIKELVHKVWKTRAELNAMPPHVKPKGVLEGLKSFESRLHWRCHFVQKLESEPDIEMHNMHRGFDGLREPHFNRDYFDRWRKAETGLPLIDACMHMLAETGWINFRMRALLVSFSSYQLWNHWREPAHHLAREFLDFEPGIHYSQIQMQSGVTGINTLRIYNPVKQAQDQDPEGKFVKRWLPALANVPKEFIFEPWTMPQGLQQEIGVIIGDTYPEPVVDHLATARHAREVMWALRREPAAREEARKVFDKHGSRNPSIADGVSYKLMFSAEGLQQGRIAESGSSSTPATASSAARKSCTACLADWHQLISTPTGSKRTWWRPVCRVVIRERAR
jgi:deoxyribodipyrimidine photo-lyase